MEVRVYAYTGETESSADRWFEAFRKGRTFVTNGPIIDFRVAAAMPGDEIRSGLGNRKLKVVAKTRRDRRLGAPSVLQVISQGEVLEEVCSDDPTKEELALSFDIEASDSFWIAARAEGHDGSYAHTTPVYVISNDMRFWRYQQVPQLIQKCRESLKEIERMVSVAIRLNDAGSAQNLEDRNAASRFLPRAVNREGAVTDAFTVQQLALQGSELLVRMRGAQKIYDELLET